MKEPTTKDGRPRVKKASEDLGRAKRFADVRKKYVHISQREAEKMLKVSAGNLSNIESGHRSITLRFLEKLSPYNINPNYILHGEKPVILGKDEKSNTLIDVKALSNRIDKLENNTKILVSNLDKAWEIISRHEKTIDELQKEIGKR